MDDSQAMKAALANIKALARRSVVERYKAKKSAPVDSPEEEAQELADPESVDPAEEAAEGEDMPEEGDDGKDGGLTQIIVMGGKRGGGKKLAETAAEMMPPKRGPGRPKKQK